jgi:hypothetical protein
MRDNTVENKNPANKLIPPNDGFDWLLHRTTISLLFRIPSDLENRNNKTLLTTEIINAPEKKSV